MKKQISLLLSAVALTGLFTACNDNPVVEPEKSSEDRSMEAVAATYVGEVAGNGSFTFDFYSKAPVEGEAAADSYGLHLVLYSDVVAPEDLLLPNIAPGLYTVSESEKKGTVLAGTDDGEGSYYFTKDAAGNVSTYPVSAGDVYLVITDDYKAAMITDVQIDPAANRWVRCEYDGEVEIEPVYTVVFETQNGWYWGDSEWDYPGIGQYMSCFYAGETDASGLVEGEYVGFDFYADMAEKAWEAQVPEGVYTTSTEYEKGKILIGTEDDRLNNRYKIWGVAHYQTIIDGVDSTRFVTDGMCLVDKKGDEYTMKFNFLCEDGIRVVGKYVGPVRQGDEYTRSTLSSDVEMKNLGFGYVEYEGPSPMANIKGVNRWNIRLYDSTLRVDPDYYWGIYNDTYGEYIVLQTYTDGYYTDFIPEGRYVISEEEVPFHVNQGQGGWGFNFGTWYNNFTEGENIAEAPAISGEVNVARDGENYVIDVNIVDDKGNRITASYNGPLTYKDSYNKADSYAVPSWVDRPANSYEAGKGIRVRSDLEHARMR